MLMEGKERERDIERERKRGGLFWDGGSDRERKFEGEVGPTC